MKSDVTLVHGPTHFQVRKNNGRCGTSLLTLLYWYY